MRVQATCDHCGRDFLFFQLYNASPDAADRCPHCGRHLGVVNVRGLTLSTDRAAAQLISCLNELGARNPAFRVEPDTILGPVGEAVAALAGTAEATGGAEVQHQENVRTLRWPWSRRRPSAA